MELQFTVVFAVIMSHFGQSLCGVSTSGDVIVITGFGGGGGGGNQDGGDDQPFPARRAGSATDGISTPIQDYDHSLAASAQHNFLFPPHGHVPFGMPFDSTMAMPMLRNMS
ncbi:hypothetical protein HDE_08456 [Halotydeus destructor]|nr:hypothetical protein HDE_08456 [Halotydeus destructor]